MDKNDVASMKSKVKDIGVDEVTTSKFANNDPMSRDSAMSRLHELKELALKKIAEGFVLKRIPIAKGYTERWVKPEMG